jgi:hypothetical protein
MTEQWQPGKLYAPGDIVQPRITDAIAQSQMNNPTFESGDSGWDTGGNWAIVQESPYAGTWAAKFATSKMVAVGLGDDDDSVAISSDGITWAFSAFDDDVYFPLSGQKIAVAPAINKWISLQLIDNGKFGVQSTDGGASWTLITPTGITAWSCNVVEWISDYSIFLYGHADGTIYTSPDGVAWTERQDIGGTVWHFAYSSTLGIVCASTGGNVWWSDDQGVSWTVGTGTDIAPDDIVWDPSNAIFIGTQNVTRHTYTSTDGKAWVKRATALPAGSIGGPQTLATDGAGRTVLRGGTANPFAYTTDGITWVAATTSVGLQWSDVTWDAGSSQFVACENGGTNSSFATSPDGDVWTERTTSYAGVSGWAAITSGSVAVSSVDSMANTARLAVISGQEITAQAFAKLTGAYVARVGVAWYDSGAALLSISWTDSPIVLSGAYRRVSATGIAPDNAVTCTVVVGVTGAGESVFFDNATISHTDPVGISQLLFKATQADPGFSDSFEPTWPTVVGNTVVDNEVTWEGVPANRVQWQAFPILVSGSSEPTFPAAIGAEVADNTISWVADTRRVEDPNCPNTKAVAITASKIFAGDGDIIAYSATINPLDWTTANDAGYIPFGLNTHGSQDVSALGLYRSNLVAFNSKGFQMWQVDEDPANFAILDAIAVGVPTSAVKSLQPVSNDLVFLTEVGIRSMGIAGASTNLQAGDFGKQIDPLVKAKLTAGEVPISLYYPGAGQYWLIFGAEAFVLTMNGGKRDMSWSRYVFPSDIDDWTILDEDLMLRSGDKIWRLDDAAERDDQVGDPASSGTAFVGRIWWPYLDFGRFGGDKQMIGFDLVATGAVTVTFGYDQTNDAIATDAYLLAAGDTLPGTIVPMPITGPSFQLRLEFTADQSTPWEWSGAILYLEDIGT